MLDPLNHVPIQLVVSEKKIILIKKCNKKNYISLLDKNTKFIFIISLFITMKYKKQITLYRKRNFFFIRKDNAMT